MWVEDSQVEGIAGAFEGVVLEDVDGGHGAGDVEGHVDEAEDFRRCDLSCQGEVCGWVMGERLALRVGEPCGEQGQNGEEVLFHGVVREVYPLSLKSGRLTS